jgi:feruloyl esterase
MDVLKALYDGPRNPRSGDRIYFGQTPGSEAAGGPPQLPGWSLYWAEPGNHAKPARANFWRYWVFDDPTWHWRDFDFDADMQIADQRLAPMINAMDADLSSFRKAGGKLLHYHGFNDPVVPATDSISYFERASATTGAVDDFYRLFLAPGVEHCRGGPGPDSFDMLTALENWVEEGEPPEKIVATRRRSDTTSDTEEYSRLLCPYPKYAEFIGVGDSAQARNFVCTSDKERPAVPAIGTPYLR